MLRKIEKQLDRGVRLLAPENQWLLEIDREELLGNSLRHQQHWLWSVEAAREAGARAARLSKGKTTSWKEILKDENYAHLPTTAPKEDTAVVVPPARSIAQSTKPVTAPTEATKAKNLGAKRAKICSMYFPKPPQARGGKSESATKKKKAGSTAAYGSGSLARPRQRQQVPS